MRMQLKLLGILLAASLVFSGCGQNEIVQMGSEYDMSTQGLVPSETFAEIPEKAVFNANIYTGDGDLNSLSAVCVQPKGAKKPLLITAFSPFLSHASIDITPADLPDYVKGGAIFDVTDGEKAFDGIKEAVLLPGLPEKIGRSDNVAAYTLTGAKNVKVFELSEKAPVMGEPLYLLSHKVSGGETVESGVYPVRALETSGDLLGFSMEKKFDLSGCVGAPIVNSNGKLMGLYVGTRGDSGYEFQAVSAPRVGEILAEALS